MNRDCFDVGRNIIKMIKIVKTIKDNMLTLQEIIWLLLIINMIIISIFLKHRYLYVTVN